MEFTQLDQGFLGVAAQVQEFLSIFLQVRPASVRTPSREGAVEQRFAQFFFQLSDGLADRRLGAEELLGGA